MELFPNARDQSGTVAQLQGPGFCAFSDLYVAACLPHALERSGPRRGCARAMRHTSPETKRRYQLGTTEQVRQAVEKANKKAYGPKRVLRFYDVSPAAKKEEKQAVCN